ncbi:MAG: hypothetical protein KDA69_03430 [Planctomycetaceae bacterium]|nr:hypothetical protein [Planctomycetaceae bacterium]MCA9043343.1 hypothetical protein [Planctomycetaceae bacterium]
MELTFNISDTSLLDLYTESLRNDPSQTHVSAAFNLTGQTVDGINFSATTNLDLFMSGKKLRDLLRNL